MTPQRFTRFRDSERGVSPVIGVILMVAITVILAAVIATFALGFAGDSTDSPPQASISVDADYDESYTVTVFNDAGDTVDLTDVVVRSEEAGDDDEKDIDNPLELSSGQSTDIDVDGDWSEFADTEVSLVWTNGDDTVLASFEVPDDG